MEPVEVVKHFVAAWNHMDFDAIIELLDESVQYHNMPLEPIQGREAVHDYLKQAWRFDAVDWQLRNVAAADNTVLTERVDNFVINGHLVSLPVMGTFVVHAGRIVVWRDYFDLAGYRAQLEAAGQ
jgi:limonene-1,2-epoxide hydrolase